jgi:hypothetical protein
VQRLAALLRDRCVDIPVTPAAFDQWLDDTLTCDARVVPTFARGLAQVRSAVRAALTTP